MRVKSCSPLLIRLNLDNADWKHPSERNEERYYVSELEELVAPRTGVASYCRSFLFVKSAGGWGLNDHSSLFFFYLIGVKKIA